MIVSDPDNKTPYIILNQIVKSLVNWTSVQFFQWAIYNPGSDVLPVTFKLTDIQEVENYLSYTEQQAQNGVVYIWQYDRNRKQKKRISVLICYLALEKNTCVIVLVLISITHKIFAPD